MPEKSETEIERQVREFLKEVAQSENMRRIEFRRRLKTFVLGKSNYEQHDRIAFGEALAEFAAQFEQDAVDGRVDAQLLQWIAGFGGAFAVSGVGMAVASIPPLAVAIIFLGGLTVAGAGLCGFRWQERLCQRQVLLAKDLREAAKKLMS